MTTSIVSLTDNSDTTCLECPPVDAYRIIVKEKGRVVLPIALQRACGFAPGDELVARPIGAGRFVVESGDAILSRIWSRLPEESIGDTGDLATWRHESDSARRSSLESPEFEATPESNRRTSRLLAEFGL